jgi:DNA-binding transcriptional regulator YdaS (Cro superfamily)
MSAHIIDAEIPDQGPTAVDLAVEAAGGILELAKLCGITYESVRKWKVRKRLPPERVLEVERFTGVSRHDLRPDLYPREAA